jgi:homocysteine S-methyltransferase
MYERMRRHPGIGFDPNIAHGALIYDETGRDVLGNVHGEYLEIGKRFELPMRATTGTWRSSRRRAEAAGHGVHRLNRDNVTFMRELIDDRPEQDIVLCGVLGPDGDAYRPEEALGTPAAAEAHLPQAEALAAAGCDEIAALTMPALSEAAGIAQAMSASGLRYFVSFVIRADGTLLDGTPLADAVKTIDDATDRPPHSYQVNCVHPSVLATALTAVRASDPSAASRIDGLQANTSARTPEELDGLEEIDTEEPEPFAAAVVDVAERFGLRFIGGCCGTTTAHMEAIARRLAAA